MTRSTLVVVATALVAALAAPGSAPAARVGRPNVVLLIGDDHGWPYAGFMGDPVARTPNLDALAAGGTLFTEAQSTSSVCVPSLRALLAGIHTDQWDAHRDAVEAKYGRQPWRGEVAHFWTVPRALAWQGYVTWEGGKLWEGTYDQAGFTRGLATAPGTLFTSVGDHFGRDGWEDGSALAPLRDFLDTVRGRPFFAWIAPLLPHYPLDAPAEFTRLYDDLGLTVNEAAYYANVSRLDALVGAIVAELDVRGLRDDTLLLYLSDNGIGIDQVLPGIGEGKGTLAELGFRTPLILNWPGHVPAGVVRDDLVSSLDVPATILDYAGADPIAAGGGASLKDAVERGTAVGHDRIVGHYAGNRPANSGFFVRTPAWRYVAAEDRAEELYAIASDPFERDDVAAANGDLLPRFRADVAAWREEMATAPDELDVAGRLTDAHAGPVGGEPLQLVGRSRAGVKLRLEVLTSRDGDFRFVAVPHGTYALRSGRAAPLAIGPFHGTIPVALPFGGLGEYLPGVTIEAQDPPPAAGSGTIAGALRDAGGNPLARATVIARGLGRRPRVVVVLTDEDGRYRAENLPPGRYHVTASVASHPGRTRGPVRVVDAITTHLDLVAAAP